RGVKGRRAPGGAQKAQAPGGASKPGAWRRRQASVPGGTRTRAPGGTPRAKAPGGAHRQGTATGRAVNGTPSAATTIRPRNSPFRERNNNPIIKINVNITKRKRPQVKTS